MAAYLLGLSTVLPSYCLAQRDVQERAALIFGGYPQFDRLSNAFETAGIDRRYSVVPLNWFSEPHGWKDRNGAYIEGATALIVNAARAALQDAGWHGDEVDSVITVSSQRDRDANPRGAGVQRDGVSR